MIKEGVLVAFSFVKFIDAYKKNKNCENSVCQI